MINDLWYKNAILYCLHVGSFMDTSGDGIGDFRGLMRRLDYLQGLGVTAIWLMPFQPSPMRDDGYDVADYYNVDPRYGTLGDFVEFTHACDQRGMRVLIDLVVNHTSDQHPWFKSARSSPDSPFRDWYVWSRTKPKDASHGVVFPGVQKSTWNYDDKAREYYFHRFYEFQPDLNTSNPEVQAEILKIMGFWMQLGVSGFRMDAVPFVIATKGPNVRKPVEQYDMLRTFAEFISWRQGSRHRPRRSQRPPRHRHGVLRRRRRAPADDVQLPGQPASLLRARHRRYRPRSSTASAPPDRAPPPRSGASSSATTTSSTSAASRRSSARPASPPSLPTKTCSSTTAASAAASRPCCTATAAASRWPTRS